MKGECEMKIDFGLMGTDPEFASLFEAFAMEEVPGQDDLDGKTYENHSAQNGRYMPDCPLHTHLR